MIPHVQPAPAGGRKQEGTEPLVKLGRYDEDAVVGAKRFGDAVLCFLGEWPMVRWLRITLRPSRLP